MWQFEPSLDPLLSLFGRSSRAQVVGAKFGNAKSKAAPAAQNLTAALATISEQQSRLPFHNQAPAR